MPHTASPLEERTPETSLRFARSLDALNFFLADVRDGLGPYLAIYLLAVRGPEQGWNEATIGLVITLSAIAGLLAQAPAGALIDGTRHKRTVVILAALAVTLACLTLPFIDGFAVVAATQSLAGVAGAVFPPALAAITLGLVGPRGFARRIGRNEAFNHAGNATSAALAAGTAFLFGPVVVFWIMAGLAAASILAMLTIPPQAIDHALARGLDAKLPATAELPSAWRSLFGCRPLLIFAALMACFHLANAAMLPTVGEKLTHLLGKDYATSLIAACIVAAQCVMVPVAALAGAKAESWGRKPIFLTAFGVLALRGALYTLFDDPWSLLGVQLLDGVGAGIFGALFPVVVADLTHGTGHYNLGQGAVATAQGVGAALSASLAGAVILGAGYAAAFLVLAAIAAAGFLGYLVLMPETAVTRGSSRRSRSGPSRSGW